MRAELTNQRSLSLSPSLGTASMKPAVAQGPPGPNTLPADESIASRINDPASLTAGALSATIGEQAVTQANSAVDVTSQGATGDGTTDDTTAINAAKAAAAAFGADLYFPPGTYLTTGLINDTAGQKWRSHPEATVKLKSGAGDGAGVKQVVKLAASGTGFTGKIDGNRAGQDKTAFNAAGGTYGSRAVYGLIAIGTEATPLTDLEIDVQVVNSIEMGVYTNWTTDSRIRAKVSASGAGARFKNAKRLDLDITCRSIDNDGWKINPHVFDLFSGTDIDLRLHSTDHNGTGTIAGGTSLEDYLVGVTIYDANRLRINGLLVETRNVNGLTRGVGLSLLGIRNMTAVNVQAIGYSDALIEAGGVVDSTIYGLLCDGRYQTSTSAGYRGVAQYANAFNAEQTARISRYTDNFKILGFTICRVLGNGIDLWMARNAHWLSGQVYGALRGIESKFTYDDPAHDWYAARTVKPLSGGRFTDVTFHDCELGGAEVTDGSDLIFDGCNFLNNGQAISIGSTRKGVAVDSDASGFATLTSSSGLTKTGIEVRGGRADDTQTVSGYVGTNPTDPTKVYIDTDANFQVGRVIQFTGAGVAGANVKKRTNDLYLDVVTLESALTTLAQPAGTGTISSTGGSTQITGSGTAFLTDFDARYFIVAAGQTRQVQRVTSNTVANVDSAFSPALPAGTSFTMYKTAYVGVPSQVHGYKFSADTVSPILNADPPTGNTGTAIADNTAGATPLRRPPRTATLPGAYKSGWYISPAGAASTATPSEASLHYTPLIIPKACSLDRLAIEVTSAGTTGAVVRLGLYAADSDGLPGALILDAGTVVATGTGVVEATISQALPAGLVYAAAVVQGGAGTRPTVRCCNVSTFQFAVSTSAAVSNGYNGFSQAGVTGALPAAATVAGASGAATRVAARYV